MSPDQSQLVLRIADVAGLNMRRLGHLLDIVAEQLPDQPREAEAIHGAAQFAFAISEQLDSIDEIATAAALVRS